MMGGVIREAVYVGREVIPAMTAKVCCKQTY